MLYPFESPGPHVSCFMFPYICIHVYMYIHFQIYQKYYSCQIFFKKVFRLEKLCICAVDKKEKPS
jgi:hypothetical protein